jgi:D-beta-D-heptose 7-phosphate kinase/D-beta-D-heptose 1-phosphate adenosyltransferase
MLPLPARVSRKVRFVSEHYSSHLLRATGSWQDGPEGNRGAADPGVAALIPQADAVVQSDYAKGVLTSPLTCALIDEAVRLCKPAVVDPKGTDFSIYRVATVITPNRQELAESSRLPVGTEGEIAAAAAAIRDTGASGGTSSEIRL